VTQLQLHYSLRLPVHYYYYNHSVTELSYAVFIPVNYKKNLISIKYKVFDLLLLLLAGVGVLCLMCMCVCLFTEICDSARGGGDSIGRLLALHVSVSSASCL